MMTLLATRQTLSSFIRRAAICAMALLLGAAAASAETLLMPKRDGLRNTPLVVWGVTTLPNHTAGSPTTFTINFGDGSPNVGGNVLDHSYINNVHTFASAGTFTVTLTVVNGGTTEVATVEVRIVDPAAIGGPGFTTGNVGAGSHEVYRDVRINMAIQDGLRYLWVQQQSRTTNFPNGTMVNWSGQRQWTAFAVTAFENHGYRLPNNNSAPTGIYEKYLVQKGLNFMFNGLSTVTLANQTTSVVAGQPAPRNPCVGVGIEAAPCTGLTDASGSQGYTLSIAMMPLAASSALSRTNGAFGPAFIQGKTYREILQRLANTLSHGQIDSTLPSNLPDRGGWGYHMNTTILDGSVMGWAILGLLDAQAATIVVPDWVKTELAFGVTGAWNTNGSFDYDADGNPATHVYSGMEKAGIGLQGMFMTGEIGGARVTTTAGYISARWNSAGRVAPDNATWNCGSNNNRSCAYSMFNNFKGLQLQGIATLPGVGRSAGPGIIPANDWHADYEDWFVNNQQNPATIGGGFWNMTFSNFGNDTNANVAIAELILSGVALVLPDGEKFATVGLSPATATAVEGNSHTVTAKAESTEGAPVAGATVNFLIISGPNAGRSGTGVTNAAGETTFTYTDAGPIPSFGTDRIRANIGTLQSNIAEMIWTPFNRPPVANPDSYSVNEDGTLNGNVVTDAPADTDPDNDELTAFLESNVSHGTLTLLPSGAFQYTPNADSCVDDSFSYSVNDGMYDSNIATVNIDVVCVNDAPAAADGSATTDEDTAVDGTVTSSDIDGGAPKYTVSSGPAHGTVTLNEDTGAYTYTPAANFHGLDSFTFSVSDGNGGADTGDVNITVTPVNDAPVAADGSATTDEDHAVSGQLSSTDIDGGAPSYSAGTGPSHGSVNVNPDGSFTYTPDANYNGPDSFTFTVSDGNGGTGSGRVDISVAPVNDPPIADDGSITTAEDTAFTGALTSSDIDGGAPSYAVVTGPTHGTLALNPDGSYSYTPNADYNGPDSFTFTVSDGAGGSDGGRVDINVTAVNDAPFCAAAAPSVALLWPPDHQLMDIDVLGVTDPVEGSTVTIMVDSIWQDEPTNTVGDGNTPIDGYGVGTSRPQLRAERSGNKKVPGDGRMYYINFTGTDEQGGTCTGTVKVGVPHDQGNTNTILEGGPLYKSTGQ